MCTAPGIEIRKGTLSAARKSVGGGGEHAGCERRVDFMHMECKTHVGSFRIADSSEQRRFEFRRDTVSVRSSVVRVQVDLQWYELERSLSLIVDTRTAGKECSQ